MWLAVEEVREVHYFFFFCVFSGPGRSAALTFLLVAHEIIFITFRSLSVPINFEFGAQMHVEAG